MDISGESKQSDPARVAGGWPRTFLGNRFIYLVLSQRAHGLSIGVNLNPDKACNFKCVYCEVDRTKPGDGPLVDLPVLTSELEATLKFVWDGRVRELPQFRHFPAELLQLKEVAISGDGEPTLSPQFGEVMEQVGVIRFRHQPFKVVVITNTAGLLQPGVRAGLKYLGGTDEIWVKLDAGTQEYMDVVNAGNLSLGTVMGNILEIARERPVVIQSLFPAIDGREPSEPEIGHYIRRLQELKAGGAQISMVQVYSAHRPPRSTRCSHLPLGTLSRITRRVREETGIPSKVY